MYRCDVCNAEYEIKPDYCDCGNDTFTYIEPLQQKTVQTKEFPVKKILSAIIFIICILLSVLVWEIGDKSAEEKPQQKQTDQKQPSVQIPDINEIWDSTPPPAELINQPTKEERNVITIYEKPKQLIKNLISGGESTKKEQQTGKETKSVQKPKSQNTTNINRKPASAVTQTKPQQPKTEQKIQTPTPVKTAQQKTEQPVVTKPKQQVNPAPQPTARMNSAEWDKYKNSLRYALLSKLDIVKITGEGDCAVSFSFDANGKLLNRKFIYQSSNKSVNDQIYLMLMKMPVFNPPPKNYKGETVKMKFYINNGYYEISFLN